MLAKSSEVESERTERKFLCIVHLLYKVVAWNKEVSFCSRAKTAKKFTKKRDARAKLLFS